MVFKRYFQRNLLFQLLSCLDCELSIFVVAQLPTCIFIYLCPNFQLQGEAALTLTCMSKGRDGGFDEIFMTKVDFPAKYDYCIRYYS